MTSAGQAAAPAAPKAGLFRPASLTRLASPDRLDLAASVVRPGSWLVLVSAAAVIAAAVVGIVFITVPIKVAGEGMLLSPAGVGEVYATAGGQVRALLVRVGDRVSVGQSIATIEQSDLEQELRQAGAELRDARDRLTEVTSFQERVAAARAAYRTQQQQNLQSSIEFTQRRLSWLEERLQGQQQLFARGFASRQSVLQTQVELGQAGEDLARHRAALKQLDAEDSAQRVEQERERLDLGLKEAAAGRRIALLQERMGRIDTVTSATAGVVAELKVDEGAIIERGTALVSIVPATAADGSNAARVLGAGPPIPLVATLYINPADGKRVRPGMIVEIVPSTVKREEFGFIEATVTSVAEVPATQEGMLRALKNRQLVQALAAGGAPFEIRAELAISPDTVSGFRWSSSAGPDLILTGGSPCKAEIVTRRDTLLELLLPPFQRLLATF